MPNAGRACVALMPDTTSDAAHAWLISGLLRMPAGRPRRARAIAPEVDSAGWAAQRLISYPA
jgi:hypothetical protein